VSACMHHYIARSAARKASCVRVPKLCSVRGRFSTLRTGNRSERGVHAGGCEYSPIVCVALGSFRRWPLHLGFNVISQRWPVGAGAFITTACAHYLNNELAGHIFSRKGQTPPGPVRTLRANYSAAAWARARDG
jgi:hypothetical protein